MNRLKYERGYRCRKFRSDGDLIAAARSNDGLCIRHAEHERVAS